MMNYDFNEWNVKLIQEPNELMETLKSFNLKGKTIKNIRLVGMCYNLSEDEATDIAYKYYLDKQIEVDEILCSTYDSIPDEVEFNRYAQIDEPIIIEFDDGDRLEIDYSEASSLKIGLNSLPKNIQCGCNIANVDGNILFSECIEEQIIGYEVLMQVEFDLTYTFTGSHGIPNPTNQESYISGFKILLTNCLEIHFNSWYDYGEVIVVIRPNDYSKTTWKELKYGIKDFKQKTDYNE